MHRRRFLAIGGVVIATAAAGCAGGGSDGSDGDDGESNGDDSDDSGEDGPAFSDAFSGESSFAYSGRFSEDGGDTETTIEGRIDGENSYVEVTSDGETIEQYVVDGTSYAVVDGQCFENPPSEQEPAEPSYDPDSYDDDTEEYPDRTPDGTETIDGEEAHYWEFEEGDRTLTYYVSVSSGRLLRVSFETGRIDYHSWGSVDPVSAPDGECTSS